MCTMKPLRGNALGSGVYAELAHGNDAVGVLGCQIDGHVDDVRVQSAAVGVLAVAPVVSIVRAAGSVRSVRMRQTEDADSHACAVREAMPHATS